MAVADGEGLEKLEDMIVRQAEATAAQVAAAKAAIGNVIFGQERVVEQALITVLCGGHALLDRPSRPRQDQAGRDHGHRARARRAPHPVHARPDALRHRRQRGAGGKPRRQAQLPLHPRPDLLPAADGRRDQPRQPAHPVGAAAGDAGAPRHGRRHPPRRAAPLPCARDAEPDRAGRHLSAAGSAARPLPDADRRRLSRPRGRAADRVRHHRRRREQAEADHDRGRAALRAQRLVRRLPVGESVVEAILNAGALGPSRPRRPARSAS